MKIRRIRKHQHDAPWTRMIERHRLRHQILRSTPCPYTLRRPRVLLDDKIARHPLRSTRSSCHELFQKHTQPFHHFRYARQRRAQPVRSLQELHELTGGLRSTHIAQTLYTGGIMRQDTIRIHFSTPKQFASEKSALVSGDEQTNTLQPAKNFIQQAQERDFILCEVKKRRLSTHRNQGHATHQSSPSERAPPASSPPGTR